MDNAASPKSPWHDGERQMQASVGLADRMEAFGAKVIRPAMPDQHRLFYEQLPFLVVGAVDNQGAPWATLLEGIPGFVQSPDPVTLHIAASPAIGDPVRDILLPDSSIGILGIELHTRRRNRVNGKITEHAPSSLPTAGFGVHVQQSFGNCPQYIQGRIVSSHVLPNTDVTDYTRLETGIRDVIRSADTFFVASYADPPGQDRAVDVSHRGGKPGFVRVDGNTLTIPDFSGNMFFNTLGNLRVNPKAGLVFVDFESGGLLHVTGSTEIVFDGTEVASFHGAQRLWRLHVTRAIWRKGAIGLRWKFGDYSPNVLATGKW